MDIKKKQDFVINALFFGIIAAVVIALGKYIVPIITPFIIAFFIAFVLHKPIDIINRAFKIPYKVVAIIVITLFYGIAVTVLGLLGVEIYLIIEKIIQNIPTMLSDIEPNLKSIEELVENTIIGLDNNTVEQITTVINEGLGAIASGISSASVKLATWISNLAISIPGFFIRVVLMIISSYFIAVDYKLIIGFVCDQLPKSTVKLVGEIKNYIFGTLWFCIRSYFIIMSITFIELSIGLSIIKIPNPILIAFIIAIFDILPVLGTGGVMIPWMLISLLDGQFTRAVGLAVIYIAITVIRNIIEPKIVGVQLGIHPLITLMSMFVGVNTLGAIGLFGFPIGISLLVHLNKNGVISIFNIKEENTNEKVNKHAKNNKKIQNK